MRLYGKMSLGETGTLIGSVDSRVPQEQLPH